MKKQFDELAFQGISRRRLIGGAAATLGTWSMTGLSGCGGGTAVVEPSAAQTAAVAAPVVTGSRIAALAQAPTPLATIPAWRTAMRARTWARIGNDFGSIDPARDPALNPNHPNAAPWRGVGGFGMIMAAWSGGAYDRSTDTLRIFGGGHQDYAGNEIVQTMLATPAPQWSLAIAPSVDIGSDSGEKGNTYPDGRPRSSHTYNQLVAVGADLYLMQGSMWRSGDAGNRLFRFSAGEWTDLGINPHANWAQYGAMCYDEKRHRLLWLGFTNAAPMVSYDIVSGVWKALGGNNQWSVTDGTARLVRIPPLDIVVTLYGGGFALFDYERTPMWGFAKPPVIGTGPANPHKTGEWVDELGAIVQWDGGTGFDTLTPPGREPLTQPWSWGRIEALEGAPSAAMQNGTFGRFFYSPRLRVLGVANGGAVEVFALADMA